MLQAAARLEPLVKTWLTHPLVRGIDPDEADATERHRRIIHEKRFLWQVYREWYSDIAQALPATDGRVLEVGSGAGFLSRCLPDVVTSDVVSADGVRVVLDAVRLPFPSGSFRAIVMTNVLHHIARPRAFLAEAARVTRRGGALIMIEPWMSPWSRLVYSRLHHEPCDPAAESWELPPGGRLSAANSALPWIIFQRDRAAFERDFPEWRVDRIDPGMPFRYLASGGLSARASAPAATFGIWRALERTLSPWMRSLAMFALIRLERTDVPAGSRWT